MRKNKKRATNVIASQPPERQPTGTPTARANTHSGSQWENGKCMLSRVYQGNLKGILKKCSRVPQWSVNGDPSKF